jgi:hypothetical protein
MNFKTVSIIKYPVEVVWPTFRDRFEDIGALVDNVTYIREVERTTSDAGPLQTNYEWKVDPPLPALIKGYIKPEMLSWNDIALWWEEDSQCHWHIVSHYFKDKMNCQGETHFQPAMGGGGCRLTFQGDIVWKEGLAAIAGFMEGPVNRAIEQVLENMIPKNFHKITQATSSLLAAENS